MGIVWWLGGRRNSKSTALRIVLGLRWIGYSRVRGKAERKVNEEALDCITPLSIDRDGNYPHPNWSMPSLDEASTDFWQNSWTSSPYLMGQEDISHLGGISYEAQTNVDGLSSILGKYNVDYTVPIN